MKHNMNLEKMNITLKKERLFSIIESLLFISGEPLKISYIASTLKVPKGYIQEAIKDMIKYYEDESRGIKLIKIEDRCQLVTKPENSEYIQMLLNINTKQSLSQAALETLAIIAYKQPVTRIEIEEIRGVKCDKTVINLIEKDLINECGRKDVPGRPILYATSDKFLKHFGLESLEKLPNLEEISHDVQETFDEKEEK